MIAIKIEHDQDKRSAESRFGIVPDTPARNDRFEESMNKNSKSEWQATIKK